MNTNISTLKKAFFSKSIVLFFIGICFSLLLPYSLIAATMDDYCIIPPFVLEGGMKANLLLTIDNSASMYDLQYVDEGKQNKVCSNNLTQVCTVDGNCSAGGVCILGGAFTRQANYCYDQTYKSKACSNNRTQVCTVDGDCSGGGVCQNNVYAGYFDFGRCSVTTAATCVKNSDCPSSETCKDVIYSYDFVSNHFVPGAAFPAACTNSKGQNTLIANTLCVNILAGPPKSVSAFVAKGNYLNWLTASKFDVEKQVLTGGKYDPATKDLIAETRGCVGRRFLKAPLSMDFINYNDGEADPNNIPLPSLHYQLELTFAVNGPPNDYNPTAPSNGGLTDIEVFEGKSSTWSKACQDAAKCFVAPYCTFPDTQAKIEACITGVGGEPEGVCKHNPNAPAPKCNVDTDCPLWKNNVSKCSISRIGCTFQSECALGEICSFPTGNPAKDLDSCTLVNHEANTYIHSLQTCWSFLKTGAPIGTGDAERIENDCYQVYQDYKVGTCNLAPATICDSDTNCTTAGDVCNNGPRAILPANPGYVCNISYAGAYYTGKPLGWTNDWTSTADVIVAMKKFCNENQQPPVIDPTDDPSDTSQTFNLPAILGDIAVEGQLGDPIKKFYVKVDRTTNPNPTGVIQEFSDRIRFGAMSFNFNGSATECGVDPTVACPKVCSAHNNLVCTSAVDCPDFLTGETCKLTTDITVSRKNLDGSQIIHYIGYPGVCRNHPNTYCSEDSQCPAFASGEKCNTAGDHNKGTCSSTPDETTTIKTCTTDADCAPAKCRSLVRTLDDIRGDAWTPFAEGFLEAIGYFARMDAHTLPPTFGTSKTAQGSINLRLNNTDYVTGKNPSQYKCQSNNVLLISDGESTTDKNSNVVNTVSTYNDGDGQTGSGAGCPKYSGSRDLDDLAWLAQNRWITDFTQPVTTGTDAYKKIQTHAVYNGASSNDPGECNPDTLLKETADNGKGIYARAEDPAALKTALKNILQTLVRASSSGTAASVLATGEESGANLLQAIFYPERDFPGDATIITWSGTLQNLWFYLDPLFGGSTIREDTDQNSVLHLKNDYVARYFFDETDTTQTSTKIKLYSDADGLPATPPAYLDPPGPIPVDNLKNLWEAGKILWQRNISTDPRKIKTYIGEKDVLGNPILKAFSTAGRTALRPYLQAASVAESEAIIRYINGEDTPFNPIIDIDGNGTADISPTYRNRTVGIDFDADNDITDPGEAKKVWKLGDIISSTPKVVSWVPLNTYDLLYGDTSYGTFICSDKTKPCVSGYISRGTVLTGANDGMLHAFKIGTLQLKTKYGVVPPSPAWSPADFEEARIINPDTGNPCLSTDVKRCGSEIWAFIPKHVLPYLKYNADPGYGHIFNVDGMPYIVDASIGGTAGVESVERLADGTTWRSILIGSMKLGGASREAGSTCTNCVKAPGVDLNGIGGVSGNDEIRLGMSSYFAIDITDTNPDNWKLLWEFSDENIPAAELADGGLGFSTTGPAVVRINPATCQDAVGGPITPMSRCNGKWFVAIPSGPTGPIDTATKQFLGRSDQKLKVFVIDLRTGAYIRAIKDFGGVINYAFGGSALDSTIDPDLDYSDDAFYLGYTKSTTGLGDSWTGGGVVRIMTKEDPDPATWAGSKLMDGIGPVTAAVSRMEDTNNKKLWIYFGTGRYFYKQLATIDDAAGPQAIYGVKDPCYNQPDDPSFKDPANIACTTPVSAGALDNVTDFPNNPEDNEGWLINLEAQNVPVPNFDAERVISDPVPSTIGATFFTTFKPSADICGHGGRSHLWAVKFNTGGTATSVLRGKALLQVSTGSIEEVNLKDAFKTSAKNTDSQEDRRTGFMTGKPPEGPGLILLVAPPPSEKVIHMREK